MPLLKTGNDAAGNAGYAYGYGNENTEKKSLMGPGLAMAAGTAASYVPYKLGEKVLEYLDDKVHTDASNLSKEDFMKAMNSMKLNRDQEKMRGLKFLGGPDTFVTDNEEYARELLGKSLPKDKVDDAVKGGRRFIFTNRFHSIPTLHELGHVENGLGFSRPGKVLRAVAGEHGLGTALASVRAARKAANPDADDWLDTALDVGEYASRAATGYQLLDEGDAWRRALGALHETKGMDGVKAGLRSAVPAFGNYAANALGKHAVAPALAALIAGKLSGNA